MQVFIGQVHLTSFSLISDTNYINQSAGRLCRALFEISLQRNWASNVLSFLRYCISPRALCRVPLLLTSTPLGVVPHILNIAPLECNTRSIHNKMNITLC